MEITLYYMPGSRSERVRWTLDELGLDYRLEWLDLFKGEGQTPEYRAIHPMGQLPALKVGDEVMIESGAIVQWLAETVPDSRLAPARDAPERKKFLQWMYFAVTSLEGPAWEMMAHSKILPPDQAVPEILDHAERQFQRALEVLEQELDAKPYLLGDDFSAADILTGYLLGWFPQQLEHRPALSAYHRRLGERPAYPHQPPPRNNG
ncbi:MAG TPA: glutathione S-transferase family protein [Gammaproteobacteria bacterium]|nr:glutathione S-transferase family protein [Gammaproteobacteria bacterium]